MITSMILSLGLVLPAAPTGTHDAPFIVHDRGAWCWFQDERVIVDRGRVLAGVVASGAKDDPRRGSVELAVYDFATGRKSMVELHARLEQDDHNVPALLVRGDGRYLAVYAKHGSDNLVRYRVSEHPGDPSSWRPERTFQCPTPVTYANLMRLTKENGGKGRIYNFYRGEGWNPNYLVSDDDGETWSYGGRLIAHQGRPYVKYASNGVDTISFAFGEAHPHEYAPGTSIYHAYYKDGNLYRSNGEKIGKLGDGPITPSQATRVFAGDPANAAWACDLHLDQNERPLLVYSVTKDPEGNDHRYRYARWDGSRWQDHEIAYAGSRLYRDQEHYTGNLTLNPRDPNEVHISTNADPAGGRPLTSQADSRRHWEIFRGMTRDNGVTWTWTPVTANSTADNLRPIMPISDRKDAVLLWLRGSYTTYSDWDLQVVGLRETVERE
jgi:hypothetical protein